MGNGGEEGRDGKELIMNRSNDHEQESNSSLKNYGERKQKQEFP